MRFSRLEFSLPSRRCKGDSAVQLDTHLPRGNGWLGEAESAEKWRLALLLMVIVTCHSIGQSARGQRFWMRVSVSDPYNTC